MNTISQRLDLRQSQNLVMTPQLQQAIKLLQLNNMELAAFVEAELAQNPLLEKAGPEGEESAGAEETENREEQPADEIRDEFDQVWTGNEAEPHASSPTDFDAGTAMAGSGGSRSFDNPDLNLENTLARQVTLREHLAEQLNIAFEDGRDRLIGALLIDRLDEGGYLRGVQDELQDGLAEQLGCAPERLDRILSRLKQFSPTGIFAADLRECLMLQLEEQGKCDAPMRALLGHLDRLAARDYAGLAKLCRVNETYIRDMADEIRALNPKPAADFEHLTVQTVVPDVLMKRLSKQMGGGWRVELNAETLPRVLINQQYFTEVSGKAKTRQDKDYLSQQMQSASWLVKAMDQRARTIVKVAGEIVERQDAFFLYGVEFLRPLTLRDVAETVGMHESTVSRVTAGKYIGTPRGLFELKYFFTTALGDGEGAHSAEAVRAKIKNLIDAEASDEILSDDGIVEILKKDGIDIARRTVAKYREAMNIPSSVQRRKVKKQAAHDGET